MNFQFRADQITMPDSRGIAILQGQQVSQRLKSMRGDNLKNLSQIITTMGTASAKAQALKQVITTFDKFVGTDNRIYLKVDGNKVLGLLKVGERNLFYRDYVFRFLNEIGTIKEMKPTCVLDFYVHESCQRSGVGKELFQRFLCEEKKHPSKLAYDRPSEKLLNFLKKHYGLVKFIPQNNNFVVFNQYFDQTKQIPFVAKTETIAKEPGSSSKDILKIHEQAKQISKEGGDISKIKKQLTALYSKINHDANNYHLSSPWAETVGNKGQFCTTSNSYGSHYR